MSAMTKKEWMAYIEKTWDAAQKEAWSEPQFECPRCGHCCQSDMSLRDYLAAKAMQIQMANKKEMNYWASEYSVDEMWGFCARNAYDMADAMLKERER